MVGIAYAPHGKHSSETPKRETEQDKQQVSPDVSEVLHMLNALQTIKNKPGSDH
ncbi:MAG: hypothetical protein ACR2OJ_16480 [Hyphomicrobiales bacterium]